MLGYYIQHPVSEEHPTREDHPVSEEHLASEDHVVSEDHPVSEEQKRPQKWDSEAFFTIYGCTSEIVRRHCHPCLTTCRYTKQQHFAATKIKNAVAASDTSPSPSCCRYRGQQRCNYNALILNAQ